MSEIIDGVTYYTVRFLNYAATDLLGTASVASGGDATAQLKMEARRWDGAPSGLNLLHSCADACEGGRSGRQ